VKTAFTAKRCQGIACGDSWQDAMLTVCYRSSSGTAKNLLFHEMNRNYGDHPLSNRNIPFDLAEVYGMKLIRRPWKGC